MKLIVILSLLIFPAFAKLTENERSYLRKLSMEYCSCRNGTYAIYFDTDKPQARVFCRNNQTKLFNITDSFNKCNKE